MSGFTDIKNSNNNVIDQDNTPHPDWDDDETVMEEIAFGQMVDLGIADRMDTLAIEPFPVLTELPMPGPQSVDLAQLDKDFTLQWPGHIVSSDQQIVGGTIDMRYQHVEYNPGDGSDMVTDVGRFHYPSQNQYMFVDSRSHSNLRMILAPVSAPLASEVVDKNVATATSNIRTLFPESPPGESITSGPRNLIRTMAGGTIQPERFIWRLASMVVAAMWAERNKQQLTSGQTDIPAVRLINSVGSLNTTLSTWDHSSQPIAVVNEGPSDLFADIVSVLLVAASRSPKYIVSGNLTIPTICTQWPQIGRAEIYYTGDTLPALGGCGILTKEAVYSAAMMYAQQHGCAAMIQTYIDTISALAFSVDGKSAIYQSDKLVVPLPICKLGPTLLTCISTSYVTWRAGHADIECPSSVGTLVGGCVNGILLGAALRSTLSSYGIENTLLFKRASNIGEYIFKSMRPRGAVMPIIWDMAAIVSALGVSGSMGSVLLGAYPMHANLGEIQKWWLSEDSAVQWEELAMYTPKMPSNSGIMGFITPIRSTAIPIVNKWYYPKTLSSSKPEDNILQGIASVPGIEVGMEIVDTTRGSSCIRPFKRRLSYRGIHSDWQFTKPYSKDFCSAKVVFRVRTPHDAMLLHHGKPHAEKRKHYVQRSTTLSGAPQPPSDGPGGGGALGSMVQFNPLIYASLPPPPPSQVPPSSWDKKGKGGEEDYGGMVLPERDGISWQLQPPPAATKPVEGVPVPQVIFMGDDRYEYQAREKLYFSTTSGLWFDRESGFCNPPNWQKPPVPPPPGLVAKPTMAISPVGVKVEKIIQLLGADAQKKFPIIEELRLALVTRRADAPTEHAARETMGHLRTAFEMLETLDPVQFLASTAPANRAQLATLTSQVFGSAALDGYSVSSTAGFVSASVRMTARARAMATSPYLSVKEMREAPSGAAMIPTDDEIGDSAAPPLVAEAIAAGVPLVAIIPEVAQKYDKVARKSQRTLVPPALQRGVDATTIAAQTKLVQAETMDVTERMMKRSYTDGGTTGAMVEEVLQRVPDWLQQHYDNGVPRNMVISAWNDLPTPEIKALHDHAASKSGHVPADEADDSDRRKAEEAEVEIEGGPHGLVTSEDLDAGIEIEGKSLGEIRADAFALGGLTENVGTSGPAFYSVAASGANRLPPPPPGFAPIGAEGSRAPDFGSDSDATHLLPPNQPSGSMEAEQGSNPSLDVSPVEQNEYVPGLEFL